MEDTKTEPCIVCGKTKCDDERACLRSWLAKRYPNEEIMAVHACRREPGGIDEGQR
jgi:hypothetical protein